MSVADPLLEIRDLHVYRGRSHILQGVDLQVPAEPVALLGRNGMGKTTLCQALLGLLPAARGAVRFLGKDITGKKPHLVSRAGIGYVPQGRRVFPSLSVHEHLRLVERQGDGEWTVERVYEMFPSLAERRRSKGDQLSGGEQQMLVIGRALVTNARLLIMDEPSEGLAPTVAEQLAGLIRRLTDQGIGLLLVEQNLGIATAIADKVALMVTGRIAVTTTSHQLLADEEMQRRYLGVARHLARPTEGRG